MERTEDENLNKVETLDSDQKESVWNFQMRPINLECPERGTSISHPSQKQRRTESSHQTVCFYKRTQGEFVPEKCTGRFAERRNGPRGPSWSVTSSQCR